MTFLSTTVWTASWWAVIAGVVAAVVTVYLHHQYVCSFRPTLADLTEGPRSVNYRHRYAVDNHPVRVPGFVRSAGTSTPASTSASTTSHMNKLDSPPDH